MFKNVASQKIALFAYDSTTGAPKTGDSANITPYVSKDYGTVTVLGTATATEMDATNAKGWYSFVLTQAETNGDALLFSAKSSTANAFIVGSLIYTDPANYSTLSVDGSGRVDIAKIAGTSQTARDIGASVITASGTVTTVTNQLTAAAIATGVWQDATAGDFTTASSIGKSLYTTGNAPGAASGLALVGSNMGTISGALTAAQIATGVWTDTTAGDFTTALSVGKSVMNGVALGTGLTVNDITTKSGYSLSGTQTFNVTGNITGNLSGSVGSVTGAVASVTGNVGGNVVGSVASVTARVTANTDQFNGDATAAANIAKTTAAIGRATVSGSPSTTSIPTSACTPAGAVANQFVGRIITFDSGTTTTALRGQSTDITASSNSATPTFTCTALTTAPAVGDTFSIT